jgi:predicted metal-dependent phosphoesterase TrpH
VPQYYADLHCHSTASDGSDAPARVVERARERGLKVLALTDHDTVAGVPEAQEAGERLGVTVVPGAELTCYVNGREVHVLGYGMDITSEDLAEHCRRFQEARIARAEEIGRRLSDSGAAIDIRKVMSEADGGVVGRPHVAKALVEAGHVADFKEAFDKYLGEGRPANVPKLQINAREVVEVIRNAGGIAVMAHPGLGEQYDLIPILMEAGAAGIEVWHSAHDWAATQKLEAWSLQYNVLRTAGSDCHGSIKGMEPILGLFGLEEPRWRKVEAALKATAWGNKRQAAK